VGAHEQLRLERQFAVVIRLELLADAVANGAERDEAFLRAFVRPFGLDQPAAPRVSDAIEALAAGWSR
jgi:hypothetical protein